MNINNNQFLRKNLFSCNKKYLNNFNLIFYLQNSYNNLLQFNVKNRINIGLHKLFSEIFPIIIYSYNLILDYIDYNISYPFKSCSYCLKNGLTYSVLLTIKLNLKFFDESDNSIIISSEEQEIFISSIPMITENGTFIINGIEKIIISRFVISPGIYALKKKSKRGFLNILRLIPSRGYNIDFYIDNKQRVLLYTKKNKLLLTTLLKALGFTTQEIFEKFYEFEYIHIINNIIKLEFIENFFLNSSIPYDIIDDNGDIIVLKNTIISSSDLESIRKFNIKFIVISKNYLLNRILGSDVYNIDNIKVANINQIITIDILNFILKNKVKFLKIIHPTSLNHLSISTSLMKENLDTISSGVLVNKFFNNIGFSIIENDLLGYKKSKINNHLFSTSGICRIKMNSRFKKNNLLTLDYLRNDDILDIIRLLVAFTDGFLSIDDMQNLNNLNLVLAGDVVEGIIYKFFLNSKKNINKKIDYSKKNLKLKINKIFNFNLIDLAIKNFFNISEYSQFLDQLNILSELSHKRRVTFIGSPGVSKKYSGFDVRDLNTSYYSRLCPVETPEGINIGLIGSISIFAIIDKYGFILAPYYKVLGGKISHKVKYLNSDQERNSVICEPTTKFLSSNGLILDTYVTSRYNDYLINIKSSLVEYIDIKPYQILSTSACLIPFINHNDSNRALMASNMLRQALPSIKPERPLIGTGLESFIGLNSNQIIISKSNGIIDYVDSELIVVKKLINFENYYYYDYENYFLNNYRSSNQHTSIKQRPAVNIGDIVSPGDVLGDNSSTHFGDIALGNNILVAFMSWEGYNFEDSIIVSDKVIIDDKYTSLEILEFNISVYNTDNGPERITYKIYNYNNLDLSNLDKFGLISIGSIVNSGDVLIGKVTPVSNIDEIISPENRLLHAVFFESIDNTKDNSFYLPPGITNGTVSNVEVYFSIDYDFNDLDRGILNRQVEYVIKKKKKKIKFLLKKIKDKIKSFLIGKFLVKINFNEKIVILITPDYLKDLKLNEILNINLNDSKLNNLFKEFKSRFKFFLKNYNIMIEYIKKKKFIKKLPNNLVKVVKIFIITKKKLQVGDKMSGRHGNKGVISKILPSHDMPYMGNGRSIDIILNPLGVPSRMNIGQLLEVHLGLVSVALGWRITHMLENNFSIFSFKDLFCKIYIDDKDRINEIKSLSDLQIKNLANLFKDGVYFGVYPFDKYSNNYIEYLLNLAFIDNIDNIEFSDTKKQIYLYDGRTGRKFDHPITVGIMYLLKLNHLVEDKIHARSIGPYSLVTQQPLKGRSNLGGQRLGEMEVWALEAYGASYTLQEMLTVKSDDVVGRFEVYKNIVNGKLKFKINEPETFNTMIKNINSLAMYIRFK